MLHHPIFSITRFSGNFVVCSRNHEETKLPRTSGFHPAFKGMLVCRAVTFSMEQQSFGMDASVLTIERSFIKSFVLPERRSRYLSLLSARGGRDKIRRKFAHFSDLDPRFSLFIPPNVQKPDKITHALTLRGAPERCYVWSDSSSLDGSTACLLTALSSVVGYAPGTILLCIPDRLAYYEGEEKNQRYILSR